MKGVLRRVGAVLETLVYHLETAEVVLYAEEREKLRRAIGKNNWIMINWPMMVAYRNLINNEPNRGGIRIWVPDADKGRIARFVKRCGECGYIPFATPWGPVTMPLNPGPYTTHLDEDREFVSLG